MKKLILLITCLAFSSLACLSSAAGLSTISTATAVPEETLVSAADQVVEQETPITLTPTAGAKNYSCAQITASSALHLRSDADPKSQVLAFLVSGEEVRLISKAKGDWWLLRRGDLVGYARAKYLEEQECE